IPGRLISRDFDCRRALVSRRGVNETSPSRYWKSKMKKLPGIAILLASLISPLGLYADDGMWTFDNPPRQQWKEKYDFVPTAAWLDHVRLASVRLNDGGSGAFVSPDGLLMTNQHVASGQLQKVSNKDRDYTKEGFYARTPAEELKCPDLEINVLVALEEVTARVK